MLFSGHESLEDAIIEEALAGPITIGSLYDNLEKGRKHLTLRAVYKAVNKLRAAGVLLKPRRSVFVNEEWAREVRQKLAGSRMLPALTAGERVAYTFVSIEHLDAFWTTVALQLETECPDEEIFFYNPHNFWAYVPERKAAEDAYYAHFAESGRYGFITLGGVTTGDLDFKRAYQNEHFQVDARPIPAFKRTDHISVIGGFVITVRMQKKVAQHIDDLYLSNMPMEFLAGELAHIYRTMVTRFVLENNPAKAQKLRKVLARNFYFKRSEWVVSGEGM